MIHLKFFCRYTQTQQQTAISAPNLEFRVRNECQRRQCRPFGQGGANFHCFSVIELRHHTAGVCAHMGPRPDLPDKLGKVVPVLEILALQRIVCKSVMAATTTLPKVFFLAK
jgi:hypothetical protein